jgi:hypothetical protein
LLGQTLDLGRHHGEAATGLARARRLDRGIEREQVGLAGDFADQLDDVADARSVLEQALHRRIGAIGLTHGLLRVSRPIAPPDG